MKFCGKCGAQLEDDAVFCGKCGNSCGQQAAPSGNSEPRAKKNNADKGKIVKFIAAGAAVIVAVFAIIFLTTKVIGSGAISAKSAVKHYIKAVYSVDVKKVLNYSMSNSMYKVADITKAEYAEELSEDADIDEAIACKDIKIKSVKKFSKDFVKDYNETILDETDEKARVKDMAVVSASYRDYDEDDEKWTKRTAQLIVYKSGGNWYVLSGNYILAPTIAKECVFCTKTSGLKLVRTTDSKAYYTCTGCNAETNALKNLLD